MNRFLCCGLAMLLWGCPAIGDGVAEVTYDRYQDRISIRATDVTLSQLLAQLAQKVGIEAQIDATVAGDRLSIDQPSRPAVDVLQHLLRRYSYILHYRADANNHKLLGAVTILGAMGKAGAGISLPPVQHAAGEWQEVAAVAPADTLAVMTSPTSNTGLPVVSQNPLVSQQMLSDADSVSEQTDPATSSRKR